jgi:hypothetical protein
MSTPSSKYYVASVDCSESESTLVQTTLQTFPAVRGAVTYDAGKARYCLDLEGLNAAEAKILIEQIQNMIELVLMQLRNGK